MWYVTRMLGNENILIIGDEPVLFREISTLTASTPREVLTANNCAEALHQAKQPGIALVLIDLLLCTGDGGQDAADIRRHCPDALFILIDGGDPERELPLDLPLNVYGYLRKPYRTGEILKTVENALDHKRLMHAHKISEIALLESEGRLANLVVNALMGISIIQNHTVVYQNPAQEEIFEGRKVPFGLDDLKCVQTHDLKKVQNVYKSILEKKTRSAELDFRFTLPVRETSKSVEKSVQCRASTHRHQGKDAILLNMMDITHARELESLVMIKDKMTSLGRVAAGIAHEIRNPLTGINSYLFTLEELTSEDTVTPDDLKLIRRITSQIQVASNKIESVIKRVLDFSRPSKAKMEMIRINDALEEALDLSAVTIRKKGITLEHDLQENLPLCYGDIHLMEQVVLNLINNAANAVEKNGGEKRIRIASFTGKGRVYVSVADSGAGVPGDLEDKIFDPFFTTRADGSGIGLSISQRIVADHGGTISVGRSDAGGAEFIIDLPVEKRMYPR